MRRLLVVLIMLAGIGTGSYGASIGGEPAHIEPNLADRDDILLYGAFESEDWTSVWGFSWNPEEHMIHAENGFDGSALQVQLEEGLWGGTGSGILMGFQLSQFPDVPAYHEEVYLRYYIRLDPDFPYVQGGKIFGLNAHKNHGGGNHPDGTNGWSGRYMWSKNGEIYLYAYLPNENGWGTNLTCDYSGKRARLMKGKWHCIEQYVKLNTVGQADGKCYTWFDGNLCMKNDTLVYRTADTPKNKEIGGSFHCFYGGSGAVWAPPYDTYMQFDNIVIATDYVGPRTGTGTLEAPVITTLGGSYDKGVSVTIEGPPNAQIRYTTNGEIPGYHSPLYVGPVHISNNATIKARAFSDDLHYSLPDSAKYLITMKTTYSDTSIGAAGDAFVRNGSYKEDNYGTSSTLYLKKSSQGYERRGHMTFSLSGIDPRRVRSATLRLYAAGAEDGARVTLLETDGSWDESTITWENRPEDGDVVDSPKNVTSSQWVEWDVSNDVSSRLSQNDTQIGFSLVPLAESCSFKSRESSSDAPELVVELYDEPVGTFNGTHSELRGISIPGISIHGDDRIRNMSSSPVALRLYDLKGTMLWSKEPAGGQTVHLPARLAPGIYLLRMQGARVGRRVYEFVR